MSVVTCLCPCHRSGGSGVHAAPCCAGRLSPDVRAFLLRLSTRGWAESDGPYLDVSACVAEHRGDEALWDDVKYAHPIAALEAFGVAV